MSLTYFDFMFSILIVICNNIHVKAFDDVNIIKFSKIYLFVTYLFLLSLLADDVILLTKLVPDFFKNVFICNLFVCFIFIG